MRLLAEFAVDEAGDDRVGDVDLVARHRKRPHRAERVLRLADQPLAVAALQVTRRHVVDDACSPRRGRRRLSALMPRPALPMITASSAS